MKNLSGIILCLVVMLNLITSNDIGVFGYISIGASIIAITSLLFEVFCKKIKYQKFNDKILSSEIGSLRKC